MANPRENDQPSTTVLEWANVRAGAVNAFGGELPHPETEGEVVDRFEAHPTVVLRLIEEVAVAKDARSRWALLRHRLRAIDPVANPSVCLAVDPARAATLAEAWIDRVGILFDRESEIVDELFGERGRYRDHHRDELLKQRILNRWRSSRKLGEELEAAELERAEHWKSTRRILAAGTA